MGCNFSATPAADTAGAADAAAASVAPRTAVLEKLARPVTAEAAGLKPVLEWMDGASVVLLGEASHGTHEFYAMRAEVTKELIRQGRLDAVAVEADFPSAARVNEYVRGRSSDTSARQALSNFQRFPTWMWRNEVVEDFVEWLRLENEERQPEERVGFYGIDVYSPRESAQAVLQYLEKESPRSAGIAKQRFACLLAAGDDPSAMMASMRRQPDCIENLEAQTRDVHRLVAPNGIEPEELSAWQNASVVEGAARYWQAQYAGTEPSWNVRDTHMADTVDRLRSYLADERKEPGDIAIWAHNSHLGDARATEMSERGEHNLGQLMRERHGAQVFSLGFSTHRGVVSAADDWDEPVKRKEVLPAREDSWEGLLHLISREGKPAFALQLGEPDTAALLDGRRLGRAIGVIYRPQTERLSHYFDADLTKQFDAIIHVDESKALRPLDAAPSWQVLTPSEARS